jgi:hypothetical protein
MSDESIIQDLEELKERIEETKTAKAQAEGKLDAALERLKNDFHIDSVEEADERIAHLETEEEKLSEELRNRYQSLRENYEW